MNQSPAPLALALLGFAAAGRPFQDAVHASGPQRIPGPFFCAYHNSNDEGIASPGGESPAGTSLAMDTSLFEVSKGFAVCALTFVVVLVALYTIFG